MERLLERFIRYCRVDTQSAEGKETYPSTAKQLNLSRMLVEELEELGLQEVELDEHGYVMATLPARLPQGHAEVPVIGFISHVDTSPSVTGADVDPQVLVYEGGEITLPKDPTQVIRPQDFPDLEKFVGTEIVTTDGTTLLGADDKAGIANIMTAMELLLADEDAVHGKVRVLFTPDEEIGQGIRYLDLDKFGAEVGYTMDGGPIGEIECENFHAANAVVTVRGKNVHPGYAKDKMVNALRVVADLLNRFPTEMLPETTEGSQGYIHAHELQGCEEEATISVLIRDFELDGLQEKKDLLRQIAQQAQETFAGSEVLCDIRDSYANMRIHLDARPEAMEYALAATRRVGLEPKSSKIRGGTDGALLSAKGLPTPNIFTGGYGFHSKTEWASVMTMKKSVQTIVELIKLWAEKSR